MTAPPGCPDRGAGMALASQEFAVKLRIPRRHGHFVFGVIQSGLTCLVAAGIASYPDSGAARFIEHWLVSWLISWLTMVRWYCWPLRSSGRSSTMSRATSAERFDLGDRQHRIGQAGEAQPLGGAAALAEFRAPLGR